MTVKVNESDLHKVFRHHFFVFIQVVNDAAPWYMYDGYQCTGMMVTPNMLGTDIYVSNS